MTETTPLEAELATLIVDVLNLEDIEPAGIDPEERLFGEGLGLDSIDALELALALSKTYGVEIRAEDEATREVFRDLRSLARFVEEERKTG